MVQGNSVARYKDLREGWLRVLDEHGVRLVALSLHSDGDLLKLLRSDVRWEIDGEDGETVVFARTHPE